MGNLSNTANLIVEAIDKGAIGKESLQGILEADKDFSKSDAKRISAKIFNKFKGIEDETERVEQMVGALFLVNNFIGRSSAYGSHTFQITETDFQFIVSIAFIS